MYKIVSYPVTHYNRKQQSTVLVRDLDKLRRLVAAIVLTGLKVIIYAKRNGTSQWKKIEVRSHGPI